MYSWLWRKLPFGLYGKLAGSLMLASAAIALLWFVVFPWAEPMVMPWDDVQVEDPTGGGGVNTGPGGQDPSTSPSDDPHRLDYSTDEPAPPTTASPSPSRRR